MADEVEVAVRFSKIDHTFLDGLDDRMIDDICINLENRDMSLKDVAEYSDVPISTVVQVARYHMFDPVTLEPYGEVH